MADKTRRELILLTVKDLVTDFLDYDRKEDEDLPSDEIENAVEADEITVEEIWTAFKDELEYNFE